VVPAMSNAISAMDVRRSLLTNRISHHWIPHA
jgi:hypothetical protein